MFEKPRLYFKCHGKITKVISISKRDNNKVDEKLWKIKNNNNITLNSSPLTRPCYLFSCVCVRTTKSSNFKRSLALGIEGSFGELNRGEKTWITKLSQHRLDYLINCLKLYNYLEGPQIHNRRLQRLPNIRCKIRRSGHYTYGPSDI